jgi:hypothetical protein
MNEQLLKFIELCLIDGVITDKERDVIFRKSTQLGVPADECEIILNGMIYKFQKENIGIQEPTVPFIKNDEEEIRIEQIIQQNENPEFLRKIFFSDRDRRISKIFSKLNILNQLLQEKKKCDLVFNDLLSLKSKLVDIKDDDEEYNKLDRLLYANDQDLIKINKKIHEFREVEREQNQLNELYNEETFKLFELLYRKTPLLFQTGIFNCYLQNIQVNNDEQILNLTRFNDFLTKKEKEYDNLIKVQFKNIEVGIAKKNEIDDLLIERKTLVAFYNSFHLMYESLIKRKMGVYMKIYVDLESMGIFNTFFEKEVINNLNIVNKNLNQLNNTLSLVSKEISTTNDYLYLLNNHMYDLKLSVDETNLKLEQVDYNLSDISNSITEGNSSIKMGIGLLEDINKGVGLNNLLTGIQTYQMYKINMNTKSLRT